MTGTASFRGVFPASCKGGIISFLCCGTPVRRRGRWPCSRGTQPRARAGHGGGRPLPQEGRVHLLRFAGGQPVGLEVEEVDGLLALQGGRDGRAGLRAAVGGGAPPG